MEDRDNITNETNKSDILIDDIDDNDDNSYYSKNDLCFIYE